MPHVMLMSAVIGTGLILLSANVDAQSTVDDGDLCESYTANEAVNLIGEDLKKIREEIQDAKNQLLSNQRADNTCATKEDLEEVKNFLASLLNNYTSSLPLRKDVLIQQNLDGSNFFNRSWAEFKVGFGNTNGNYWLGNDKLSQLTLSGNYRLRFDLQAVDGTWYWAHYTTFRVSGEADNYRLNVSGYASNTGYDALDHSSGMMFTTYDRDNDGWSGQNCAVVNRGGFWYNKFCAFCSVNGARGSMDDFRWNDITLQTTRMWLMWP